MFRRLSPPRLCLLGVAMLLAVSAACRLDRLLKSTPGPRPVLAVDPAEVRDSARAGSHDVRSIPVALSNSGDGTLTWSASDHDAWIHLDPSDGGVPDTLTISLDPDGLNPGVYESNVTITAKGAADSQVTTIPVTFLVQRPGLSVSPTSIERSTHINSGESFTETLQITNSGSGALNWTASENLSWLSLGVKTGTGNGSIPVTIASAGLVGGTYRGDIVITAPGAVGSPAHVAVTLTVLAPGLAVAPASIKDTAAFGSTAPETVTLHITNSGNGDVTWTATKSQLWLSLSKVSGGAPDEVAVTMNPTGLAPGVQSDTIVFTAPEATNGPVKIPVDFVIAQPGLSVVPATITTSAEQNDNKKQQFDLSITNSGGAGGTLAWLASANQPWIGLSPLGGLSPSTLSVVVDPQGLAAGVHTGTVTISAPGAAGSPVIVPVTLTITSRTCAEISVALDVINRPGSLGPNDCEAPHRPGSLANLYAFSVNAGDTISVHLTAQFDPYLILTDGAGNVLAQNHDCPSQAGASCIVNYPIAAGGRYLVEATSAAPGATGQLTISIVRERPPTAPQSLGQFRATTNDVIDVGGTIPETEVVMRAKVDDPTESDFVRLEVELEPLTSPFTGAPTHVSDYVSAAGGGMQTSVHPTGLVNRTQYRWQARTCDSTGRCSAWLPFGNNADTDADFTVVTP